MLVPFTPVRGTPSTQGHLSQQQQLDVVGDRYPMAWAYWLIGNSSDPRHGWKAFNAFLYANQGFHPEYAAYMWLYNLKFNPHESNTDHPAARYQLNSV